ncbi:unnamed protein product [Cuscuta europaea]|uniref:Poly(A) RNA polymerase mitochondrial-like central palm domain-containing protein n=1 Tax=Cuscuta europaea TaxID=41803 RepID=A0A9P0YNM0_CUSEU|nr:unnamed protein product [Cuscuta europaea]
MAVALRVKVLRKKSERLERKRWQKYVVVSEKVPAIEDLLDSVYTSLRPKPSDYEVRRALVFVFNVLAKDIYGPGSDAPIVEEFGSFLMDLFTTKSDLDLSINFGNNAVGFSREKRIQKLRKFAKKLYALQREGHVYGVHPITTANVPILKVVDRGTRIECDISVENRDGVLKSKIVHMICSIDERFGKLSFLMKAWAKAHNINSSKFKTLNSMSIVLLVAFHLQTRNPPILPPFSALYKDGADSEEAEKLVCNFSNYGKSNKESVAELFMTLLIKLLAVENLWCKGICASTYEGSWISKTWDFKVACISVEDFTDRSQNVARAVGVKEVKKIYKCIHNSSERIAAFMEGRIEGSTLKEYLFGQSGCRTLGDEKGSKDASKDRSGHKKEVVIKAGQQTIPHKPAVAGWDSVPSGKLGRSATKVWGKSTSGSWGKSMLDGWGGSTISEENVTATSWGGSQSSSLKRSTVEGWGGSTTECSEKPTAKAWGGSQSTSWGKSAVDALGGSSPGISEKQVTKIWGGSESKSWEKPAVDTFGGSSTPGNSEKQTTKGWGGSKSKSWGKPLVDVWLGSNSGSLEKSTAKGWGGSTASGWSGKPTAKGWEGSTASGWSEKPTAKGWGRSELTSRRKSTVDVGGGWSEKPTAKGWGRSESTSWEKPMVDVGGGWSEKPTAKGWGRSESTSWGKPTVDVRGGWSEKPTAKGWGRSELTSWGKPMVNVGVGSQSSTRGGSTTTGRSKEPISEKPSAKSWGGSQFISWGKQVVGIRGESQTSSSGKENDGGGGSTTSGNSEKQTAKCWGGPQPTSWGKEIVDVGGGSSTSGISEKLATNGWGRSASTSWGKPTVGSWGGKAPECSRKSDSIKRKWSDENEGGISAGRWGTSSKNGRTEGRWWC